MEHSCPLPTAADWKPGQLLLCECGRLWVVRTVYVDAVCPTLVNTWRLIKGRRWWRR